MSSRASVLFSTINGVVSDSLKTFKCDNWISTSPLVRVVLGFSFLVTIPDISTTDSRFKLLAKLKSHQSCGVFLTLS